MYLARKERYSDMTYNRTDNSGLKLPAISLGLWQKWHCPGFCVTEL